MVMVVAHNRKALLNRLLGLHSPIIDIEHLQLFHPGSIRQLLRNAGFVDIKVHSFANTYPLRYWIRLLPIPSVRDFMHGICARTGLLDKHLTLPVGNMVAMGTKPKGKENHEDTKT
jgi:hypothetical protein